MTSTRQRPPDRPSLRRTALTVACLVGLLGGCDLRLETPPLTAPTPGPQEVVRDRAATDAESIAALATQAAGLTTSPSDDPAVAEALAEVATTSGRQAVALGGHYEPWTATPTPSMSPTPTPEGPPATATDVVTALRDGAASAASDADSVTDGGLARLLGSVSASRAALATWLDARVAGTPLELPTELSGDGPAGASDQVTAPPTGEEPASDPSASSGAGSAGHVAGVQDSALNALLKAEDVLGAGWEVLAARSSGEDRSRAALVAAGHRDAAQQWALSLEVDGTALDPRRDAYALPTEVLDPTGDARAALLDLEGQLADRFAALVAQAQPGSRARFVDALTATTRLLLEAKGSTTAFPGIGDGADSGAPTAQAG